MEAPPPVESEKKPAPPPAPQGGQLWRNVAEICKNQLTPMYWFMLDDARGTLEGDELVVRCGDELTLESLNCPEVAQVLGNVTGEKLGKQIRVRFAMDTGDAPPADKLEELIRRGGKYDSFVVKP